MFHTSFMHTQQILDTCKLNQAKNKAIKLSLQTFFGRRKNSLRCSLKGEGALSKSL